MLATGLLMLGVWSGWPTSSQQETFTEIELPPPAKPHVLPPKAQATQAPKRIRDGQSPNGERKNFTSQGWTITPTEPPNPLVIGLELDAVERFNKELRTQLASNTYAGPMLVRVRNLAVQANDAVVRELAIENLGRSHDPKAQELLIDCFENIADAAARTQIVSALRPDSTDGKVSRFLISQLASAEQSNEVKRRALSQLVGASLALNLSPQEVMPRLPNAWREPYRKLFEGVAKDGFH